VTCRTILIVDDEDNIAPLEIALTGLNGLEVVVSCSAKGAMDMLQRPCVQIAAVVTDLHLPHVDGFELIEMIRGHERYFKVPIVVVSGDGRPDVPERVRMLGADAFFPKPYSPAEVRNTLKGLLDAT
jgi:CheY-like chemotaxis protein